MSAGDGLTWTHKGSDEIFCRLPSLQEDFVLCTLLYFQAGSRPCPRILCPATLLYDDDDIDIDIDIDNDDVIFVQTKKYTQVKLSICDTFCNNTII